MCASCIPKQQRSNKPSDLKLNKPEGWLHLHSKLEPREGRHERAVTQSSAAQRSMKISDVKFKMGLKAFFTTLRADNILHRFVKYLHNMNISDDK